MHPLSVSYTKYTPSAVSDDSTKSNEMWISENPTLPFLPNSTVFAQNPKTVLKNTDIYPFLKRLSENRAKTVELGKNGRVASVPLQSLQKKGISDEMALPSIEAR